MHTVRFQQKFREFNSIFYKWEMRVNFLKSDMLSRLFVQILCNHRIFSFCSFIGRLLISKAITLLQNLKSFFDVKLNLFQRVKMHKMVSFSVSTSTYKIPKNWFKTQYWNSYMLLHYVRTLEDIFDVLFRIISKAISTFAGICNNLLQIVIYSFHIHSI